jgi:ribosomal protein S18 acetylase RimI-like enzyme
LPTSHSTNQVADLYVRPEHRGAGWGGLCSVTPLSWRHSAGAVASSGWVLHTNEPALQFYRRLNSRAVDEIGVHRLDGDVLLDLATDQPART